MNSFINKLLTTFIVFFALSFCLFAHNAAAAVYVEDFSGDLSAWTAGPSHIDSYGIVSEQLFIDGQGHNTGDGGWGTLMYDVVLGSSFTATWDAKITYYEYANFVLFAEPYTFDSSMGRTTDGYLAWMDIDDPTLPKLDLMGVTGGTAFDLASGGARNVVVNPDIPLNQWHQWRLEKNNDSLKVYINDALYIDASDPVYASSNLKFGLSFGEDSQGYFDNLRIETSAVPEPTTMLLFGSGLVGMFIRRKK